MKSIKPGRGPSMMGAFGSAAAALFGVFWTLSALSMGAPIFFALFGVVFVALGIGQAVYNFKNATSQNRYSTFDITDGNEEPDPLNRRFGGNQVDQEAGAYEQAEPMQAGTESAAAASSEQPQHHTNAAFCPYCGAAVDDGFSFCPKCGKQLPII